MFTFSKTPIEQGCKMGENSSFENEFPAPVAVVRSWTTACLAFIGWIQSLVRIWFPYQTYTF